MTKKDFIALADHIRARSDYAQSQLAALARHFKTESPRFNAMRWLAYVAGECGPNGGKVKVSK